MSNEIKVGMMVSVSGGPAQKVTHVSPPSGARRDWRYRVGDRCHSGKYLKVVPSSIILHNSGIRITSGSDIRKQPFGSMGQHSLI